MIHFNERLKIKEDYYTWIEKTKEATGFEIKDCPHISFIFPKWKRIFERSCYS